MAKYRHSSRNKARRRAVDTIFEAEIKNLDQDPQQLRDLLVQRCQMTTAQTTLPEYSQTIVSGVADHLFEIDSLIDQFTHDWALDRLPLTDLAILRCAVWEIRFNEQVPWKIAVDEAVGISQDISTDDSPRFLNGVLDAIARLDHTDQTLLSRVSATPVASAAPVEQGSLIEQSGPADPIEQVGQADSASQDSQHSWDLQDIQDQSDFGQGKTADLAADSGQLDSLYQDLDFDDSTSADSAEGETASSEQSVVSGTQLTPGVPADLPAPAVDELHSNEGLSSTDCPETLAAEISDETEGLRSGQSEVVAVAEGDRDSFEAGAGQEPSLKSEEIEPQVYEPDTAVDPEIDDDESYDLDLRELGIDLGSLRPVIPEEPLE